MPAQFEYDHLLHPTTLDGIFQAFVAGATDCNQALVPTAIGSIYVSASLPMNAGEELQGFSRVSRKGFRNFVGPIYMSDKSWKEPKVVVKGIFCTELGALSGQSDSSDDSSFVKKLCSQIVWKEDVNQIGQKHAREILSLGEDNPSETSQIVADLDRAAKYYMSRTLAALSTEDEAALAPHLAHFVQWMHHRMSVENVSNDEEIDNAFLDDAAAKSADGRLLHFTGENLVDILQNKASSSTLAARDDLMFEYHTSSVGLGRANKTVLRWLDLQAHKRPDCSYLELSGSSSALTLPALEILGGKVGESTPRFTQYTFTSAYPQVHGSMQKSLKRWQDRTKFKTFDINKDPFTQGFEKESFDVIIASNVSHLCHCYLMY